MKKLKVEKNHKIHPILLSILKILYEKKNYPAAIKTASEILNMVD